MPKMKTNKAAKKRFKKTGTGKIKRRNRNLNHLLEKKSSRRKRRLRSASHVSAADTPTVNKLLKK